MTTSMLQVSIVICNEWKYRFSCMCVWFIQPLGVTQIDWLAKSPGWRVTQHCVKLLPGLTCTCVSIAVLQSIGSSDPLSRGPFATCLTAAASSVLACCGPLPSDVDPHISQWPTVALPSSPWRAEAWWCNGSAEWCVWGYRRRRAKSPARTPLFFTHRRDCVGVLFCVRTCYHQCLGTDVVELSQNKTHAGSINIH